MLTVVPGADTLLPGVQGERLQPAETEIQARTVAHRPREHEAPIDPLCGQPGDFRPTGIIEAHHFGSFVERFAGGIVEGFAQQFVLADSINPDELRMAARDQQSDEREFWRLRLQHRRQQVAFHVVHAQGRNPPGKGQRLGAGSAHQQRPHQARAGGVGDAIDLGRHAAGFGQDLADQGQHALDVIAGGKLGHHPAVGAVQVDLAEQRIGQQPAFAVVKCDTGFVAGGF